MRGMVEQSTGETYAHEKESHQHSPTHRADQGDKRYVRRNAKGEFNKVVDVGKSLPSDKRTTAKKKVPRGQGDRGDLAK